MLRSLELVNAFDKIDEFASDADGSVILTYSLSLPFISSIISRMKDSKKNIRIMYSIKSNAQRTINQLKILNKKYSKPVETTIANDRYESSHAKIYLFTKRRKEGILIRVILGSFNLTYNTLNSVELYGSYTFVVDKKLLKSYNVKNFIDFFGFEEKPIIDMNDLKECLSGEDKEIGYEILLLLFQHWFKDISVKSEKSLNHIDFFNGLNSRIFVTTFGNNSLLHYFAEVLRSAFVYADKTKKEVQLTIITPFHTEVAIENLFNLKNQILKDIAVNNVKFSLRFLTNSFNVSSEQTKTSFSDPTYLRNKMFSSEKIDDFKVKFWGYTPENEDFIHAKIYSVKVGDRKVILITSANLTSPGFSFDLRKNLEVGVIENHTDYTEDLFNWVEERWKAEYLPRSREDKIWSELQKWYDRLTEAEEESEDFNVEGLADLYTYRRNVIKVRNLKNRQIRSMKIVLSFPKKEKPVKNIEKRFQKEGKEFVVSFTLKEEHLGNVFCDVFAEMVDGSLVYIIQKRISVIEKFPKISGRIISHMGIPEDFVGGTIPIELIVQIGKGISKIDLARISFELYSAEEIASTKILLIREKIDHKRTIRFVLWSEEFHRNKKLMKITAKYENETMVTLNFSREPKIFTEPKENPLIKFDKNCSLQLTSDENTLCPRCETEIQIRTNRKILKQLKIDHIMVVRDFSYSELIGIQRTVQPDVCEVELRDKVRLKNDFPSNPPTDVETWVYAVKKASWTTYVPLGKINYRLLKNPPKINFRQKTLTVTNVTPVEVEFEFDEKNAVRDKFLIMIQIARLRRKLTLESTEKEILLELTCGLKEKEIEKGLDLEYRFCFKYNLADVVGKVHIHYDFFVTCPHSSDPTIKKMLIFDLKNSCDLLNRSTERIAEKVRPVLRLIPAKSTDTKSFTFNSTNDIFDHIRKQTFALTQIDKATVKELSSKNLSRLSFNIYQNKSDILTIPFDLIYLEGVITNHFTTKRGGFGETVTIYHPPEYQSEFRKEIINIVKTVYINELEEQIEEIRNRDPKFSWIMNEEDVKQSIKRGKDIINRVKNQNFIPLFKPKTSIHAYEATTFSGRKFLDLILFVRRGKHELKISIADSCMVS